MAKIARDKRSALGDGDAGDQQIGSSDFPKRGLHSQLIEYIGGFRINRKNQNLFQ